MWKRTAMSGPYLLRPGSCMVTPVVRTGKLRWLAGSLGRVVTVSTSHAGSSLRLPLPLWLPSRVYGPLIASRLKRLESCLLTEGFARPTSLSGVPSMPTLPL
ncbi:hypothetical protein AS029_07665 [Microbacterium enclense]|nr:hypothetical protein AS029_07665 [Microbacterium enclense]